MRDKNGSPWRRAARIASRQHGVISLPQLIKAGISRQAAHRAVDKGVLHRVHRGVYRFGHEAPSTDAFFIAAVLACGDAAVLSNRAAAFLYGLIKGATPAPEITSATNRHVEGIITHRVRHLDRLDVAMYRGIPITTVPRTIVDLADRFSLDDLARLCHEAEVRHGTKPAMVAAALARRPNTPGAWKLHEIFRGEVRVTLSDLEDAFLALLKPAGFPLPETNRPAGGRYVDCRWPEHRLTVELDSYTYHHTRHGWEQDRRRKWEARARGDAFLRYTYADVTADGSLVLDELRPLLSGRG